MSNTKFTEKDFEKIRWRVDKIPLSEQVDPTKYFPEMLYHKEFTSEAYITHQFKDYYARLICYIVCVYDPNSPFVRYNENIIKCKRDAAEFAGFRKKDTDGHFYDFVEQILANKHDIANRMILKYLKILKNSEWAALITYKETLYSQLGTLRDDIDKLDGKQIKDVIGNTTTLREEIATSERNLIGKDLNPDLIEALYDTLETDELDLTPEDIAMRFALKQEPKLYNPYLDEKPIKEFILQHQRMAQKD